MDELWGGEETLIVISTDLSHFLSYAEATQVDTNTCNSILEKSSSLTGEEACGASALNGLMRTQHAQALRVELLDVCNSGDTAGDKNRVVGYGAFLLH
jgi:AmmeMemoRadiSam system protein B